MKSHKSIYVSGKGRKQSPENSKSERVIFFLYLAYFLLIAVPLAIAQPVILSEPLLPNPPDEISRLIIPMYIAKFGKLPTGYEPEVQIAGYGGSYAFFPCFPYMIMGAIMRAEYLCGLPDYILIYTARLVNVTSGVLMAVGVRKLAGRVFNDRGAAWVFAFAVMFWPEQLFVHTYVNCESMSQLSIVIILLALVGLYQDGPGERNCILLSAGLILCILTYYNAYGYVLAAVALFFGWFAIRIHETKRGAGNTAGAGTEMDKTSENSGSYGSTAGNAAKDADTAAEVHLLRRSMGRYGRMVFLIVLIGAGWWFVRSGILHNGDLFGLKTLSESRAPREELFGLTYYEQGKSVFTMFKETGLARTLLRSFIACYGSLSIWAGPWLYRFDEIFLFGGAALCIVFRIMRTVRRHGSGKKSGDRLQQEPGDESGDGLRQNSGYWTRTYFHIIMILAMAIVFGLWLYYCYRMDFQAQGRYLLATVTPLFYYCTSGWLCLADALKIRGRARTVICILGAAAFVYLEADFVFGTVIPICLS